MSATASTESSMESVGTARTALIIDGSYAIIGARKLGGKIDYIKLRAALEVQASTQFGDCWFFDQNPSAQRLNPALTAEYNRLKFAPPEGPQFQVSLFPMKRYSCHCKKCGNNFTQNVQKGVDNGIATKILSLAYENICDRFILFAGDGDFYSSLSHVRNVLRKDIWVIGYRGTVSGDLQQLASRVIWLNDLWPQVQSVQEGRFQGQGLRTEERRDGRRRGDGRKDEDVVRWFEDREGENVHLSNGSASPLSDVDSGRQVVIAPAESESSHHANQPARGRGRGREERVNGRGCGRNGRGRSRSRSRGRSRPGPPNSKELAVSNGRADVETATSGPVGAGIKRKKGSTGEGKRAAEGRNGKKRKRNGPGNNERGRSKRGGHGGKETDDVPVVTLSDFSSDEELEGKPFPLALPVPVEQVMTALSRDAGMDEIGSRTKVIDLASDTESEC